MTFSLVATPPVLRYSALTNWIDFDGTEDYTTLNDTANLDIFGTEVFIAPDIRGMTMGGWFRIDTLDASLDGLATKWTTTSNKRSYALYLNNNLFEFAISQDGTAGTVDSVASSVLLSTGQCYFVVGRFDPSTTVEIFVNGTKDSSIAAQASIYNSNTDFRLGSINGANFFDGQITQVFLCCAMISDNQLDALYQHTRAMFGV